MPGYCGFRLFVVVGGGGGGVGAERVCAGPRGLAFFRSHCCAGRFETIAAPVNPLSITCSAVLPQHCHGKNSGKEKCCAPPLLFLLLGLPRLLSTPPQCVLAPFSLRRYALCWVWPFQWTKPPEMEPPVPTPPRSPSPASMLSVSPTVRGSRGSTSLCVDRAAPTVFRCLCRCLC